MSKQTAQSHMTQQNDLPMVAAVDLGGTQIRTAVLRGDRLLSRVGLLTGDDPLPKRILPRIFAAIDQALDEAGVRLDQIAGIGVGAPGPLNSRTGVVYAPPNLAGWHNVPLRDLLEQQFHLPTFIENDANAAALGEYMFGAGRGCTDIVYLTISTGIGGGVILGGKLLQGISGTAAELGHMSIDWQGERCNCGNIGCLEQIASGVAIARRARAAIAAGKGNELRAFALSHSALERSNYDESEPDPSTYVSARIVALAAKAGVPLAEEIVRTTAEAIGVGLVNIIHIFNPEMIILGGGVTQIGAMLLEPMQRVMRERAMQVPYEAVKIVLAQLGSNVGLVGAGALIYYNR
ncbi:MAG: ROK family protein [Ktedonobacteraceae bacterium]|nr:ROK family protein [Ktedonobacteraceae bacterium]MBV9021808.1 ROK family protein [Ktedonobacteraceae bacterium]